MRRYIAIDLLMTKQLAITLLDWALLENIHFMSNNPSGYCYASKETLADIIDVSRPTIYRMIEKLEGDFIEKDFKTSHLKVTKKWIDIVNGSSFNKNTEPYQIETDSIKLRQTPYQIETNTVSKRYLKEDIKEENKGELRALDFLIKNSPELYESFERNFKKPLKDFKKFVEDFNDKIDVEGLEFTVRKINARLNSYARNYVANQNKFTVIKNEEAKPTYLKNYSA